MFRIRPIGAIAVAVTLGLSVTACTNDSTDTSQQESDTSVSAMQHCYPPETSGGSEASEAEDEIITTDPSGATAEDLLAYLTSPERVDIYEGLAKKAGPLIADQLKKGRFGWLNEYNEELTVLKPDYRGWGGIQAYADTVEISDFINASAYARVWWNGDGTIDPDKSVHKIAISDAAKPTGNLVFISLLESSRSSEDIWGAYLMDNCSSTTNLDLYTKVKENGWEASNVFSSLPASLAEAKEFDDAAIAKFEANMASWNIDGWE